MFATDVLTHAVPKRVYLIGTRMPHAADRMQKYELDLSIAELKSLADSVGNTVIGTDMINLKIINSGTFIGKGRVETLAGQREQHRLDRVIFDAELTPTQQRNLSEQIGCEIIDRTELIIELFVLHARSHEAKIQVDLARLQYLLPRLRGRWQHLERQEGSAQVRGGPGETQTELDRRAIADQISRLKKKLKGVEQVRATQRHDRTGIFKAAIVGYTNAGKSSLFNALTGAEVKVEDKLFATLDATTRRLRLSSGTTILLSDTVGFIRRLPPRLIESFKSTLEVVTQADLLVVVLDIGNPHVSSERDTVLATLKELGVADIPMIEVYNKIDLITGCPENGDEGSVFISATKQRGLDHLRSRLDKIACNYQPVRDKQRL